MGGAITIAGRDAPERACVGCGRRRGQAELVRFSRGPAGLQVHLEPGEGRGAYICPDLTCLGRAVTRQALQKALGGDLGPLSVQRLREAIHQAVLQRITRILGVARRTRRVVTGVSTVAETLERGGLRLVFSSRDAFPGPGAAFQAEAERRGIPVVTIFSPGDLHSAFGGPSHGAIGLLDGGCAEGVLRSLRYRIPLSTQEKALDGAEARGRGGGRRG